MKYKFCSIRINVTKYDVTFATKGGYATDIHTYRLQSRCFASLLLYWNAKGTTAPCPPWQKDRGEAAPLFQHTWL